MNQPRFKLPIKIHLEEVSMCAGAKKEREWQRLNAEGEQLIFVKRGNCDEIAQASPFAEKQGGREGKCPK